MDQRLQRLQRLMWALCVVTGGSVTWVAQGQTPDCEPATRACFDIRVDLPVVAEPSPREGYDEARAESCGAPIPVTSDHPLYQFMTDADGDGQVCE